jgi:polar amino acid transport system ATP-binding protein/sulfate transport system ATP-binding protein
MNRSYELKETLVSIDNVSLKFGDRDILKPVNAIVKDIVRPGMIQGQVVGILGPSGVGKTQFSRILAGLQTPTTGSVNVLVKDKMEPVCAGAVGVVFQDYPLFMHRTVLGNLLVALEQTTLSNKDRETRAMEYLQKFDLVDKAKLYPAQLSGGQRQRVSIIQELLCSENFLVMDEPFTGLDPMMKDKVCDLINLVATLDEKNTIFVVAHDIQALVSIADTLWLFGREKDVNGTFIPGASIKAQYDLIQRGLAWQPGISELPEFHATVNEIKRQFHDL